MATTSYTNLIEILEGKLANLTERLSTGAKQIQAARDKGEDVQEWEEHWIMLLRQYEDAVDRLELLTNSVVVVEKEVQDENQTLCNP